ncbi:MAG: hypothetical protein RIN56_02735 [Sporomusaceae bacterium]|nr:hypothetical protein [Sporomusaceae bacterium]
MNGARPDVPGCFEGEACFSGAAVRLREHFRLLWEQHVYWTRMVIISIAAGSPDLEATTARLLRNATDMARPFGRFYGRDAAAEFARLIRDHLTIAAELVTAAKAGDNAAAATAERRWYANGEDIVRFLSHVNPCWRMAAMRKMWFEHLALTKAEAVARLGGEYARDIEIFDRIEKQALLMADEFAAGISRQFGF